MLPHLDVSAARDLHPIPTVSNHIVLHYLPGPTETDAVATVLIDAVTTKLHFAVFLHCDATTTIVQNAVCNQSGQLAALQHSNAVATVTINEVGEYIQGLTALHVQADSCGKGEKKRALQTRWERLCARVPDRLILYLRCGSNSCFPRGPC